MFNNKEYNKIYQQKNKDKIRQRKKQYYIENKDKITAYHIKNRKRYVQNNRIRRDKCIASWEGYFPKKTNCEICNKELLFNVKDYRKAIHFDHRNGGNEEIKSHPSLFLYTRYRNEKNQKIWEGCNFGYLCRRCNMHLHTNHRKEYLRKVIKYVFGENYEIKEKAV